MFLKILAYTLGVIIAIPVLLWFALRGMFRCGWNLLCFICQRQYRELKRLCERGTADELQAFLAKHPGAREYVIYIRQNQTTSIVTSLFRLPAPLDVARKANNLAVIPVLLANGASPEVRSVSAEHTPAEAAIGSPDTMRILCGGKTWWQECSPNPEALIEGIQGNNARRIIWNVLRGTRLDKPELLDQLNVLPMAMKEFVCRFGIDDDRRDAFLQWVKEHPVTREQVLRSFRRLVAGMEPVFARRQQQFDEGPVALATSMQPLPPVHSDDVDKLMYSASLLERPKLLELLSTLFSREQQFALLRHFLSTPFAPDNRELTEETVDLLLCSLLATAEN